MGTPTIHVTDLCNVVAKLLESESLPYLLAVDSPPEEAPQTLSAVVQSLSKELGTSKNIMRHCRVEFLIQHHPDRHVCPRVRVRAPVDTVEKSAQLR